MKYQWQSGELRGPVFDTWLAAANDAVSAGQAVWTANDKLRCFEGGEIVTLTDTLRMRQSLPQLQNLPGTSAAALESHTIRGRFLTRTYGGKLQDLLNQTHAMTSPCPHIEECKHGRECLCAALGQ